MSETILNYDVVIVGGGLAGLTAAAYLSKKGKSVVILEKGKIGGRAATVNIKGYNFNFGAHAVYGKDTSVLNNLEKELALNLNWSQYDPEKAKYDLGEELSHMPSNLKGLLKTKVLTNSGKVKFTWNILNTILRLEKGEQDVSLGEWLEKKGIQEDVKEMILSLVSSNFFTNEPERIPSKVFFDYYHRLFKTKVAVSYINGGWQTLIEEYRRVIDENNGVIVEKAKIASVVSGEDGIEKIVTAKDEVYIAKDYVFCIPPKELEKLFAGTNIESYINRYSSFEPTYAIVYDLGLSKRIERPFTYIHDRDSKVFITDISYYDKSTTPEGGQLLQGIAYMSNSEVNDKEKVDAIILKIESLYDKHFDGWRDILVVPKISKKAVVQELKWNMEQSPMPIHFEDVKNLYFAGDWCVGNGQLSELSFSSAHNVTQLILSK